MSTLPGLETSFSQPIRDNVLESISQIDGQIVVKIKGEDLRQIASTRDSHRELAPARRASARFIDRAGSLPQYMLDIDRAAAARYGINIGDIQDLIETAMAGKATSELWEGERHFTVVVRLRQRAESRSLEAAPGQRTTGAQVPLSQLANITLGSGAMNIARENGTRVDLSASSSATATWAVVADMQARAQGIEAADRLRHGLVGRIRKPAARHEAAGVDRAAVHPADLHAAVRCVRVDRSALLIIANIPFALIGGIVALSIPGIPLSVSAAIGFIALFGQAVLNGVVIVSISTSCVPRAWPARGGPPGQPERLRTVLMTALLAMLGLLPMALSHAIGSETQRPLAVVVIGGLVSATMLTLLLLPTLYVRFAHSEGLTS